jgi:flavodoxin
MNSLVAYFAQGGNTRKVAKAIAEELAKAAEFAAQLRSDAGS